jgi:hypothetical protein
MVTSRSVPQQTVQMLSARAGQSRFALRFSQIGHAKVHSCSRRSEFTLPVEGVKKAYPVFLTTDGERRGSNPAVRRFFIEIPLSRAPRSLSERAARGPGQI